MLKITRLFEDTMAEMKSAIDSFPWTDRPSYAGWLAQTFYYVNESSRLLALASSRISNGPLQSRFITHAREEFGHEKLALADLEFLGYQIGQFIPLASTCAFYQTQYYWIEHRDPLSFFGYILLLEGAAVTFAQDKYSVLRGAYGERAVQFLKVHAQEDTGHLEKALAEISKLGDSSSGLIAQNLSHSADLYKKILSDLNRQNSALLMKAA